MLVLFMILSGIFGPTAAAADRTNFVIFLADDLGWGDLACYGHPQIKTPISIASQSRDCG